MCQVPDQGSTLMGPPYLCHLFLSTIQVLLQAFLLEWKHQWISALMRSRFVSCYSCPGPCVGLSVPRVALSLRKFKTVP